ncbi:MAG: 50S ribosomal protein L6 [Methanomicrobiales archaeon]|nr:50S ribosomal protein L6 [Methanomicrobiales archaeon]
MGITHKITVPAGVTVTQDGALIRVSGPKGMLVRELANPSITITTGDKELIISTESNRKEHIALCGTFASHLRNMVRGVTEGFTYRMKVVYSHFPIQLKQAGNQLEINNFLGEKHPRYARVEEGVKVQLGNDEVTLEGTNKESLGTTASNIEHATKIRYRDPRVFQDGIYLTERA